MILGRRLCSPNLKDIAGLEDAQLILQFFPMNPNYPAKLGRRLYSPNLKDIARLEDAQLIL